MGKGKFIPGTKVLNATGTTLTQADKDYIAKTYAEIGAVANRGKTLEAFTSQYVAEWSNATEQGYIPKGTTIVQYLDKIFPVEKRANYKAKLASDSTQFADLDAIAEKNRIESEQNYVKNLEEAERRESELAKPFYLRTKTFVIAGISAVGIVLIILAIKKFRNK